METSCYQLAKREIIAPYRSLTRVEDAAGNRKLQAHEESLSSVMHDSIDIALHKANGKGKR